jgi:hypothetical protein
VVLLLAVFEYLFFAPLAPTAWGGPRGAGPFENSSLPDAGRWSRDARLVLERIAKWRSPSRPLEATAEMLAGWHAFLSAARCAILWLILRRLGGCGLLATFGVVMAFVPVVIGGWRQSDVDVGLVLFVVLMAFTTAERIPWGVALFVLPVLFALWANAHASVVVGLAWLGVMAAGRAVEWWKKQDLEIPARPAVGRLLAAIALCAAAACANPDGPRLFLDAFEATKNPSVGSQPGWQPIDFTTTAGMPWTYFGSISVLLLVQLSCSRPFSPTALLITLSFGIWPLVQQRGADYWWLILPWLIVPQIAPICLRYLHAAEPEAGWGHWVPAVICGIAILATPAARWFITGSPRSLESIVSRDTPAKLALELTADAKSARTVLPDLREQLRATYPNGKYRGAILGGTEQGDFLAWVLDGDNNQPVMIYNRPEALDQTQWAECHKVLDGETSWWEITARHQVNLIVIDSKKHGKLVERLRAWPSEWRTVQDDGPGGLFISVRRVPKLPVEFMTP